MAVLSDEVARLPRARQLRQPGLVTICLINAAIIVLWFTGAASTVAVEDGVLETLQLLVAAGACALFLFAALEDDGPVGTAGAAISAIAAIAVVREIDVRNMVVPDWMMIWAHGPFRDTTVIILLALILAYLWWRREHFQGWLRLLLRMAAWPFWLSGVLLTSSLAFDGEKLIAGPPGVMVEELIELNGLMLLLMAGFRHCRLLRDKNWVDRR